MRLELVTGRPFIVFCKGCGKKQWAGDVETEAGAPVYTVWADLDGEPFRAYYCAECAKGGNANGRDIH